jgi:small GTP-binding protein
MGNFFSRLRRTPTRKILILGQEKSGKTTIFSIINQKYNNKPKKLMDESKVQDEKNSQNKKMVDKSIGFNVDLIKDIVVWDLSGNKTMSKFWSCYFDNVDGVIWVLDAFKTDNTILDLMHDFLSSISLEKVKILVFIHKSDSVDEEVTVNLTEKVESMFTNRKIKITSTSVTNPQFIYEGFDWLNETMFVSKGRVLDYLPFYK